MHDVIPLEHKNIIMITKTCRSDVLNIGIGDVLLLHYTEEPLPSIINYVW